MLSGTLVKRSFVDCCRVRAPSDPIFFSIFTFNQSGLKIEKHVVAVRNLHFSSSASDTDDFNNSVRQFPWPFTWYLLTVCTVITRILCCPFIKMLPQKMSFLSLITVIQPKHLHSGKQKSPNMLSCHRTVHGSIYKAFVTSHTIKVPFDLTLLKFRFGGIESQNTRLELGDIVVSIKVSEQCFCALRRN